MEASRKRRASCELQMETKITDLPDEILAKIFKPLPQNDLFSLTLQCKRFNHIVCDGLISINVSPRNLRAEWIGSRKHTKVIYSPKCKEKHFQDFMGILASIGEDITHVSMRDVNMNPVTLNIILSICKKVKVLHLPDATRYLEDYEMFRRKFPSMDLVELECGGESGRLVQLLQGSLTKKFTFNVVDDFNPEILRDFLKSQKNLKYLCLSGTEFLCWSVTGFGFEFFNSDALNSVEFRLKTLVLNNIRVNNENFKEFIDQHAATLSHVELEGFFDSTSILNCFGNVKKIKKLIFIPDGHYVMENFDVRANVDELEIAETITFDLAIKFPNLIKLKICYHRGRGCLKLGSFERLTHLSLQRFGTIRDLTISASTKFIRFASYEFATIPTFEEFQFEEITLINCKNVNWLAEFLSNDETRVKNLTIESVELPSEVFNVILKNGGKITNFVSKGIKFL